MNVPLIEHRSSTNVAGVEVVTILDEFTPDALVVDYKITSDPAMWLSQAVLSYQPDLYAIAMIEAGREVRGVQYRLLARPSIKLKKNQTPEEYEAECVEWLCERPAERIVEDDRFLSPARMESAKAWLVAGRHRVQCNRASGVWPANHHACKEWNAECEFLPLCVARSEGHDFESIVRTEYAPRQAEPQRAEHVSFSRLSCLFGCEAKFQWRYERNLERKRAEYSEALAHGSLFHQLRALHAQKSLDVALFEADRRADEKVKSIPEHAERTRQETARVKAMVRVAAERWPVNKEQGNDPQGTSQA